MGHLFRIADDAVIEWVFPLLFVSGWGRADDPALVLPVI
jgi:hypothetical protein